MGRKEPWSPQDRRRPRAIERPKGAPVHHGVLTSCNGYVYSFGAAILDLEKPWIVRYRCRPT